MKTNRALGSESVKDRHKENAMKPFMVFFFLLSALSVEAVSAESHYVLEKDKQGITRTVYIFGSNLADLDFAKYPQLEIAMVLNHRVSKVEMEYMLKAGGLRCLTLGEAPEGIEIDDDALSMIKSFQNVEHIQLCRTTLTDADLQNFQGLKKLKSLYIELYSDGHGVKDGDLNSKLTDSTAKALKQLPELQTVRIRGKAEFTDEFVAEIATLRQLKELDIASDKMSDATLESLAKMNSIQEVEIYSKQFTAKGLEMLRTSKLIFARVNGEVIVDKRR
jgi:hypothetical protein